MNDNVEDEGGGGALADMEEEDEEDDVGEEEGTPDARRRLMDALVEGATLDRIRSVVEAHPDSVECVIDAKGNGDWCSALRMAIFVEADYDVVDYLAQRNPDALRARDHRGRLPLHLAIIYRPRLSVVRMLVEMYPQALRETIDDKTGHLPLHCAFLDRCEEDKDDDRISVERHGRPDVTVFLILQHPEAVRARTANGHLPLHLAFADDSGMPFLRWAAMRDQAAPIEVVSALLAAWPDSVFQNGPSRAPRAAPGLHEQPDSPGRDPSSGPRVARVARSKGR